MNKENYEGLRKQLDNGSLDIPSQITILEIAYNLEQQLQFYKQKEDKIREYTSELSSEEILLAQGFEPMYVEGIIFAYEITKEDILQILNEGK